MEKTENLKINVIFSTEEIIEHETRRVRHYLEYKKYYDNKGINIDIRFPNGIKEIQKPDQIKDLVSNEYYGISSLYNRFRDELLISIEQLLTIVEDISSLYGFPIYGNFKVMPTAYGSVGSPSAYGEEGPIVFRIPELRPKNLGSLFTTGHYRTTLELLFHEILAHKATSFLRKNTCLDDSVKRVTHQEHKEYLMDLLGQTSLSELGLMPIDKISMQLKAIKEARKDIDPLYFTNNDISWRGNLKELIKKINTNLSTHAGKNL